jgi:K+-sensing histidine kinase KdpD
LNHSTGLKVLETPGTGSVGLGLSVTRSIVWEHGGDISLATRKGGGLSVRLELPAGPAPSAPVQEKIRSSGQARELDLGDTDE